MSIIALIFERTIQTLHPEATHDCLVLVGVGSGHLWLLPIIRVFASLMRILNLPCTGHSRLLTLGLLLSVATGETLAFTSWEQQLLLANPGGRLCLRNLSVLSGRAWVMALNWISPYWVFVRSHWVVIIVIKYTFALCSTWLRVIRDGSILAKEVVSFVVHMCLLMVVTFKLHGMWTHLIDLIGQQVVVRVVCARWGLGSWTWVAVCSILITSWLLHLLLVLLPISIAVLHSRTLLLHLSRLLPRSGKADSCFKFRLTCLDLGRWLVVLDFSPLV